MELEHLLGVLVRWPIAGLAAELLAYFAGLGSVAYSASGMDYVDKILRGAKPSDLPVGASNQV